MMSRVFERRPRRFSSGALIASALVLACSGPSENDFFGAEPGASGRGGSGNMAGMSGAGNAGTESGGSSAKGGSVGTGGSVSGAGGSAGSQTTGGSAGMVTGGTAGIETGGTAGSQTGGSAGLETGGTSSAGSGGVAGSAAGTTSTEAGAGGMNEAGAAGGPSCVPEQERCDGIDNDCEDGADDGNVCPDGCVGAHFEGHDYLFCLDDNGGSLGGGRTWSQARTFCVMEDKVLVHLETESEAKFVYAKLVELDLSADAWMGATDRVEDEWCWEGATSLDTVQFYDHDTETAVDGLFIDWREGEPNDGGGEDCGAIEEQSDGTYLWDDRSCSEELELFVCEGEP